MAKSRHIALRRTSCRRAAGEACHSWLDACPRRRSCKPVLKNPCDVVVWHALGPQIQDVTPSASDISSFGETSVPTLALTACGPPRPDPQHPGQLSPDGTGHRRLSGAHPQSRRFDRVSRPPPIIAGALASRPTPFVLEESPSTARKGVSRFRELHSQGHDVDVSLFGFACKPFLEGVLSKPLTRPYRHGRTPQNFPAWRADDGSF